MAQLYSRDGSDDMMKAVDKKYRIGSMSDPLFLFLYIGLIRGESQIPRLNLTLPCASTLYSDYGHALFALDELSNPDYRISDTDVNHVRECFYRLVDARFSMVRDKYAKQMYIGVNDPCICGSGKKYKKCHGRMPIQEFLGLK